jgi:hypothetical protein
MVFIVVLRNEQSLRQAESQRLVPEKDIKFRRRQRCRHRADDSGGEPAGLGIQAGPALAEAVLMALTSANSPERSCRTLDAKSPGRRLALPESSADCYRRAQEEQLPGGEF